MKQSTVMLGILAALVSGLALGALYVRSLGETADVTRTTANVQFAEMDTPSTGAQPVVTPQAAETEPVAPLVDVPDIARKALQEIDRFEESEGVQN